MHLDCAGKLLDLSRPVVMGILNVTPDSFSDGGRFCDLERACAQAWAMVEQGAAIIDVGGESTKPGAEPVDVEAEKRRVMPVIERLAAELPVPISVDTSKAAVMRAAVASGAGFINDVYALRSAGALDAAVDLQVPVCLMHMQGEPRTMQESPTYRSVVADVRGFLMERIAACETAGLARSRLVIDPGFGFGKSLEHNLGLLKHLSELVALGLPVLVGMSRKSMIGAVIDAPSEQRLHGSVAAAVLAVWQGASLVRAHDVGATVQALKLVDAVRGTT